MHLLLEMGVVNSMHLTQMGGFSCPFNSLVISVFRDESIILHCTFNINFAK